MILLIDNYDSFTYNLCQMLTEQHAAVTTVRNDKITIDEITALKPTAIVLSPGPGRPDNAGICLTLINKFAPYIPILGVCLGHQAIAQAFGANIVTAPTIVHGKADTIFHHNQSLFYNLPQPFKATRYHSLCVSREHLPSALQITAENNEGIIMGIKHQHYPCFGVQFHPESIISEHGELLLKRFLHEANAYAET